MRIVLVVVCRLVRFVCVIRGVRDQRPGDSRDIGQVGRGASQGRRPTLQEELPVVDYPGACRTGTVLELYC